MTATDTIDTIDRLPGIDLPSLNARARMMTRFDRKYLLCSAELDDVVLQLPKNTQVLDIAGQRRHHYSTCYFDTPDLLCYRMTAQKRRRRFKIRQRTYRDTGTAFCEIKTAGPRGTTVKNRIGISLADAASPHLAGSAREFLAQELGGIAKPEVLELLGACLWNSYQRTTLYLPGSGRATVDTHLKWRSFAGQRLDRSDLVFIETKSNASPSSVDRILWSMGHRPVHVSKFGTGLAAMHHELPANKWRRIINNYFE